MPVNDASAGLVPLILASTHFVSFVVHLSQVASNGHSTPVSQYTFNDPLISSYVLQDEAGTGASVQIAFSSHPAYAGGPPVTVTSPSSGSTPTPTAGLPQTLAMPLVAAQDALASQGIAELSLTGGATVTNEALTGFSLAVTGLGVGTMYGASALIKVTATMPVDSTSAADLLQATLGGTVYKSALLTARNLATDSSYELLDPSITAHLLQVGTSGDLVQVVLGAKSVQVVVAPKFGGSGWTATAAQFKGQIGQHYAYNCPVPGPNDDVSGDDVWGTTTYADDSSVCAAAVNYGLITIKAGGTVTIQIEPGAKAYTGSNRNGTTTESSGSSTGSFVFIGQPIFNADVGYGGRGWDAYPSSFPAKNGQRYLYICPPKGSPQEIFGTGTYTTDSPVCTAAVQEGLITLAKGGNVTIEIEPGIGTYTGSSKNGVTSISGSWSYGSYVFVTTLLPLA
jgi:hypothetical protein